LFDSVADLSVRFSFAFAGRKAFRQAPFSGVKKRVLSAAGGAAMVKAAKKRWAKVRSWAKVRKQAKKVAS
jgi:hypothetical protein